MTWVIHIARPKKTDAWHADGDYGPTERIEDARMFTSRKDAEEFMSLCGLYRLMNWKTTVRKVKR